MAVSGTLIGGMMTAAIAATSIAAEYRVQIMFLALIPCLAHFSRDIGSVEDARVGIIPSVALPVCCLPTLAACAPGGVADA